MALEQYAKIVDSIVRGAEQLRASLERAAARHSRATSAGAAASAGAARAAAPSPAAFSAGGGHRVLDLLTARAGNARSISAALFGSPTAPGPAGGAAPRAATAAASAAAARTAGGAAGAGRAVAAVGRMAAAHPVALLVAALVAVTVWLVKTASALKATAEAAIESRRALAEIHPGMAAVMAMKDLVKRREDFRIAAATVGSAERQLDAYRRAAQATRDWEVFTTNLGAHVGAVWSDIKASLVAPLNAIAKGMNRILGWEAKLPRNRNEAVQNTPLLRGLERWKRAEPRRSRVPRPHNRRP